MIELPPGWTVRPEPSVGYTFFDDEGRPITQHPNDGDTIRRLVWDIWRREEAGRRDMIDTLATLKIGGVSVRVPPRALIIGGTHGLGKALAARLADMGWRIEATGRADFDIGEPDTWEPWASRTGPTKFDLVIFCAGIIAPETWYRKPMEAYLHSYRVHAAGPVQFLATYRDVLFGWWTRVVFISSVGAVNAGAVDLSYGMAKAAIEKAARALAEHESWPVTLVRLDLVDTRMLYALPTDTLHGRPILSPDEAAKIVLKEAGIK